MKKGKKQKSVKRFQLILKRLSKGYLFFSYKYLILKGIGRLLPSLRLITHKSGQREMLVPYPLKHRRRLFLAVSWFLKSSEHNSEKSAFDNIVKELIKGSQNELTWGIKQNLSTSENAIAGRSFAHYRWF